MTNASSPLLYTEDVETIPSDEAEDIQRVIIALQSLLKQSHEMSGQFRADVHVKTHGYAEAELRILPNLPDELAQGLFGAARNYQVVVRFSNAAPVDQSDAVPDGRGMAMKVMGVDGTLVSTDDQGSSSQDFVMINHPVFFARNVKDYLRLEQVLATAEGSTFRTVQGALTGGDWNPVHWHWREMLTAAQIAGHIPAHPAGQTYFSMAPIRYGKYVAKYRARPVQNRSDTYLDLITRLAFERDAMRLALEQTLKTEELLFEFQVQLRTSVKTMPIEDASIEWPESESPFRTVAQLVLPKQEIADLRHQDRYRNLSFNVWHALHDHRPLGGINRVRRSVYPVSSNWRRQEQTVKIEVLPGDGHA